MKDKRRFLYDQKKYYIKVPQQLFKIGLSPAAFMIYVAMLDCPESFNPSLQFLEMKTGMARATLTRAIRELREHFCIELLKRGIGRKTSEYRLVPPGYWSVKRKRSDIHSVKKNKLMGLGKLKQGRALRMKRAACPPGKHVDYIIPIVHENVCGLNVPWNMQYLTYDERTKKSESFDGTYANESWRRRS